MKINDGLRDEATASVVFQPISPRNFNALHIPSIESTTFGHWMLVHQILLLHFVGSITRNWVSANVMLFLGG